MAPAHHERADGSGSRRRATAAPLVASDLVRSTKTVERHVEQVSTEVGVSTRGAGALYAMDHDVRGALG
ncbi:MAG: hypothetical protein M3144_04675 [Actinomycetota bacterium]|nr:hypothetical protein [Actinomycetota bacterium]